jgi:RNA polymerase sigma factor (sigma-70 family)
MLAAPRDVEAARRGDRHAYARLVEKHQRLVTSITLAITADVAASEDAAQEAFLCGWRDLRALDDVGRFGPWICQIARNRAYDAVRRRKKAESSDVQALEGAPDPTPDALESLVESEKSTLISRALASLPEDGREAMILYYREGQSVAQVADALGVSEEVVRKRLSRARERMRDSVEKALGAALLATAPASGFRDGLIGRMPRPAVSKTVARLGRLARVARFAGATAVIVIAARSQPVRNFVQSARTAIVAPGPARIHGTIAGHKDATGTVTVDFGTETRTATISGGVFDLRDVPLGRAHVTVTLDGDLPSPEPADVTIVAGALVNVRVKVVLPKAAPTRATSPPE